MDLLKDLTPELLQALKSTQANIPPIGMEYLTMTEEEKRSMSFNDADQQFVLQLMQQVADNIKGEQANSISAQNYLIHSKLSMINEGYQLFEKNKEAIKNVGVFDTRINTVEKTNKKLTWAIILIIILIILMIVFGPIYHNRYLTIFKDKNKQGYGIEDIYTRMRTGEVSDVTRAIHLDLTKLSQAQQDSIREENIKAIEKTIK